MALGCRHLAVTNAIHPTTGAFCIFHTGSRNVVPVNDVNKFNFGKYFNLRKLNAKK
jgi:hypothetical protein